MEGVEFDHSELPFLDRPRVSPSRLKLTDRFFLQLA